MALQVQNELESIYEMGEDWDYFLTGKYITFIVAGHIG